MINPALIWRGTIDPNTAQIISDDPTKRFIKDVVLSMNGYGATSLGSSGQWFIEYTPNGGSAYILNQGQVDPFETVILHLDMPLEVDDALSIEYAANPVSADLQVHVSGFTS